jgi:peptide/nickel transport system permease protein
MATGQSAQEAIGVLARQGDRSTYGRWQHAIVHFLRTKPLGSIGAAIVVAILLLAVFAPQVAPFGFDHRLLRDKLQGPSANHWLGTDIQGRDVLSRLIYGARVSAFVGFGAVLIATTISSVIGLISGFFGGLLDTTVQRFVDVWIAFPALILLLAVLAIFGTPTGKLHLGLLTLDSSQQRAAQVIMVLGLIFSAGASRVIRGAALSIRNNLYVEGARTVGAGNARILWYYILPNVMPTIIVLASLQLGAAILAEASLSFLGFGIPDPVPSWGLMLSGLATARIRTDPLLTLWPGLAITIAVFGFNMLGDALRDVLDPRLRGGR